MRLFVIFSLPLLLFILSSNSSEANVVNLREQMPNIKGQGNRGTCSVFAATSIMEFLVQQYEGRYINLSEEYNYWVAKKYTLINPLLETYKGVDALAGYLAMEGYTYGSVSELDFPYHYQNRFQSNDPLCIKAEDSYVNECFTFEPPENIPLLPYKLKIQYISREEIGNFILAQKRPALINIKWCYDAVDKVTGIIRMPTEADLKNCGGHVITLVGFDSEKKEFIFRNSWGEEWGDHGYGYIPEQYIIDYCETCSRIRHLNDYSENEQELYLKASKGISGELIRE
ncbi:MAG: hypothetical protein A2504_01020 [Bdellovibrionales bacterium RIFOXYD12_FULL_39_22]|nr:MAG: hypothetical protein A2385_03640 [Bdellovibrionales bacterium RIFOXYB1_FULL_39_21]OFZ42580.1 MAG: hypothetical protein A2485_09665 [Bdellovibrionales bacterium RIFOXYC12_FULL_39_17]OFZ47152.1 MAG: hypothetical protein A2404_15630 [Bdellovibrionales bacterium RIFOXYC1_FULL_39_130]OFZ75400.1 MAG: hypothetical protein A2560_14405 [Bdellovibrionales bacterium RIFOXYD1_FULL_39_84]OFZ75781.1 MAG: hypothetical protein A2451_15425 [Bdellovibrionales bacterium RIFOXYC2_FULL_39_8]OFZ93351.1 MAG: